MNILILLIFISLLVASGFVLAFIWAVRSGQFDDASTPAIRILIEDNASKSTKIKKTNKQLNDH
ncbi:MAG: cbb3-type cytochrome oxidase maturation protein [Marivirga sp.]|jgi:cbb3-type cytochrome oxidase maturation protein